VFSSDKPHCRVRFQSLTRQQVRDLRASCKAHGVTVNAALVGALTLAVRRHIFPGETEPVDLCVDVCVDARRFCQPPVDGKELGCMYDAAPSVHRAVHLFKNSESSSLSSSSPTGHSPGPVPHEIWDIAKASNTQLSAFTAARVFETYQRKLGDAEGAIANLHRQLKDHKVQPSWPFMVSNVGVQALPEEILQAFYFTKQTSGAIRFITHVVTCDKSGDLGLASTFVGEELGKLHDAMWQLFSSLCHLPPVVAPAKKKQKLSAD